MTQDTAPAEDRMDNPANWTDEEFKELSDFVEEHYGIAGGLQ